MAQKEGINTPLVVTLGLVSTAVLAVVIFGTQAWYQYMVQQEEARKWNEMADRTAVLHKKDQLDSINVYKTESAENKKAGAIPIGEAMNIVAQNGGKLPAAQ